MNFFSNSISKIWAALWGILSKYHNEALEVDLIFAALACASVIKLSNWCWATCVFLVAELCLWRMNLCWFIDRAAEGAGGGESWIEESQNGQQQSEQRAGAHFWNLNLSAYKLSYFLSSQRFLKMNKFVSDKKYLIRSSVMCWKLCIHVAADSRFG